MATKPSLKQVSGYIVFGLTLTLLLALANFFKGQPPQVGRTTIEGLGSQDGTFILKGYCDSRWENGKAKTVISNSQGQATYVEGKLCLSGFHEMTLSVQGSQVYLVKAIKTPEPLESPKERWELTSLED